MITPTAIKDIETQITGIVLRALNAQFQGRVTFGPVRVFVGIVAGVSGIALIWSLGARL